MNAPTQTLDEITPKTMRAVRQQPQYQSSDSSLKRRAVLFILGLIVALSTALSTVYYLTMAEILVGNLEAHGNTTANNLADSAKLGILLEDADMLRDDVANFLKEENVDYIWILNKDGEPLLSSYLPFQIVASHNTLYNQAIETGTTVREIAFHEQLSRNESTSESIHMAFPVWRDSASNSLDDLALSGLPSPPAASNREIIGAIQIGYSKNQIDEQLSSIAWRATFLSLAVGITAAIFAATVLQKWLRPLQSITDMAHAIRRAGFQGAQEHITDIAKDYRMESKSAVKRNDEIGQLYQTFMEMLTELGAYDKRVREQKVRLKEMVSEQTAELLQAKTDAENANNTKSTFLASMSHEIRTPLNAVIGFTQILQKNIGDATPEQQKDYLDIVHTSAQNLLTIIDDILDLSKLEAGQYELDKTNFSMAECAKKTVNLVQQKADEKAINLQVDCPEISLYSDERLLTQIMLNLLKNSVKFTGENGAVSLAVRDQSEHLSITVTDNGQGMNDAELERAVKPFIQASGNRFRGKAQGPGLGLPLVEHFVRLLGGSFAIYSEKGEGTVARVKIPKS